MWRKVTEIVRFLCKICNSNLILAISCTPHPGGCQGDSNTRV